MKIVIAALSAPAQLNGVSRHSVNLVRALLSTRTVTDLHFLAGEWQREMFQSALGEMDARLHTHWISLADANWSRLIWYYRELPLIAAQLGADLVHLSFPAPMASHAFHCPTILSLHDMYPFDIPQNFGRWRGVLARWTLARCLQKVDAIACVSTSTRLLLESRFSAEVRKSVVIPNIVETRPLHGTRYRPVSIETESFVLCVAQHRCNKNVPLAIRVFERALERRLIPADSRLVVVGITGPETKRIQEEIRALKLDGRVMLLSGLSDDELQWCYENCIVLLAPSSMEGFGLPVAEGTLAGCRIVCSDIPAFREVGGEHCWFVPWEGSLVEAYADAIGCALAQPKPMGMALPHLSVAHVGRHFLSFYQDVICSRIPGFDILRPPEAAANQANPVGSRTA
ncbi:glycosyltransferase family 4 protein [Terracidiphilus gabretensis]|uniref:glycosyltransferase family 4 protein n=1 Tax=Terracidiphilus gabretensis TaxID=1577687 RepID=UPI0009EAC95C